MTAKKLIGGDLFWIAPILMILILLGPIVAGMAGVLFPAFGFFPSLGGQSFTVQHLIDVTQKPGFWHSLQLSIWIGLGTTFLSLAFVALFFAAFSGKPFFRAIERFIAPLMSVPHAAIAFGFAFLIAPSGWLMRLLSPSVTGFDRPPDWLIVNDPMGFALLGGLVLKEVPFLFLVALAAASQIDVQKRLQVVQSMGYGRIWGFLTAIFPALYIRMRLPIVAVLAYSTSVVDMAIILGPNFPAMLPVQLLRWMNDPELEMRFVAAAGALWQIGATLIAILVWYVGERLVIYLFKQMMQTGGRLQNDRWVAGVVALFVTALVAIATLSFVILAIWSVAGFWRFPNALPKAFSIERWLENTPHLLDPIWQSCAIGFCATAIALLLTLGCLENEYRRNITFTPTAMRILYLPLIVPQIAFMFGISILLVRYGWDGHFWSVVIAHLVFVLPYVFLSVAAPFRQFDTRFLQVATALGASPMRAFLTVRLPMLLKPILLAMALGMAVSIAQYLPTLLIGAGRIETITTEAVALASGGDRRLIGIYAITQALLPAIGFVLAAIAPKLFFPNKRYFA
jgi:putative thiamine transport system permease protein